MTVGSFHAGTKHNVISDTAKLQLTVRSYKPEVRERLLEGIRRIAIAQGLSAGLTEDKLPKVTMNDTFTPALYNDPALVDRVVSLFESRFGTDQVVQIDPVMGGEDFSRYGTTDDEIPSFMFRVGVMDKDYLVASSKGEAEPIGLHSKKLAPVPEPSIRAGVEAMTAAALDILKKP